jgi:hypothetical protein
MKIFFLNIVLMAPLLWNIRHFFTQESKSFGTMYNDCNFIGSKFRVLPLVLEKEFIVL